MTEALTGRAHWFSPSDAHDKLAYACRYPDRVGANFDDADPTLVFDSFEIDYKSIFISSGEPCHAL